MKVLRFLTLFGLLLIFMSGCAQIVGNMAGSAAMESQKNKMAKFPEASKGFEPKKVYNIDFDRAWKTVMTVLDQNKVMILSSDKGSKRIMTDYITGAPVSQGPGGIFGVIMTRYKYQILFRNDKGATRIDINCKLESRAMSSNGGGGASDWHDISTPNKAMIDNLENWLYEQIEKAL